MTPFLGITTNYFVLRALCFEYYVARRTKYTVYKHEVYTVERRWGPPDSDDRAFDPCTDTFHLLPQLHKVGSMYSQEAYAVHSIKYTYTKYGVSSVYRVCTKYFVGLRTTTTTYDKRPRLPFRNSQSYQPFWVISEKIRHSGAHCFGSLQG